MTKAGWQLLTHVLMRRVTCADASVLTNTSSVLYIRESPEVRTLQHASGCMHRFLLHGAVLAAVQCAVTHHGPTIVWHCRLLKICNYLRDLQGFGPPPCVPASPFLLQGIDQPAWQPGV